MIVVSDTTAITNLFHIGQLSLLVDVFGKVIIPPAVEVELSEIPGQWEAITDQNFINVIKPFDLTRVAFYKAILDDGEAEAIALAIEVQADFIVMDEWKGRRLAKHAGLHVIGLVGVLLTAKRKGIVSEIGPILTALADVAGFRLHPSLVEDALREAGEV